MVREAKDKIRGAIAARRGGSGGPGEASIELHETQFTIVARIERLDDLAPPLTTEFHGVPSMIPAQSIFRLPYVVIEALRVHCASQGRNERVLQMEIEQSINIGWIAIS